jgi:iron complex outermembrane receptor protein
MNMLRTASFSALAVALAASAPASAQTQDSGANADDNPGQLEEIFVTARRVQESLQDVPVAVSALNADTLANLNANSVRDIEFSVPNLYLGIPATNTQSVVSIRGVGDYARNIGTDLRVGVYLDGVYMGRSSAVNQEFLDVDRIEVLRGPQGVVFGRNTIAGAINLVSKRPTSARELNGEFSYGNYDAVTARASANLPLSDTVFARVGIGYRVRDGYTRNLFTGSRLDEANVWSTRGQLRFVPDDRLTIDLDADYLDEDRKVVVQPPLADFPGTPVAPGVFLFPPSPGFSTAPAPRDVNLNFDPREQRELWGVAGQARYDFDGGPSLVSITAYREARSGYTNDDDTGPADVVQQAYEETFKQFSQELRLEAPTSARLGYVLGLYYFHEEGESSRQSFSTPALALAQIAFGNPYPTRGNLLTSNAGRNTTDAYAAFANFTYRFTDALTLEIGGRLTHERKRLRDYFVDVAVLPGFPPFIANRVNGPTTQFGSAIPLTQVSVPDVSATNFAPSGSLSYKLSERALIYGRISRGFRSGGFNADLVGRSDIRFSPETASAYEIGLKSDLLDRRVRLNAALFRSDFNDYQVFQFVPNGNLTTLQLTNAGQARSQGFEIETQVALADFLRLGGNIGYTDAKFRSFPGCAPGLDCAGQRLPNAPEWTWSANAQLTHKLGAGEISLFTEVTFRDDVFTDSPVSPVLLTDSLTLWNANLSYAIGEVTLFAFGENLTDETRKQAVGRTFLGVPNGFYNAPRTYGAGLRFRF